MAILIFLVDSCIILCEVHIPHNVINEVSIELMFIQNLWITRRCSEYRSILHLVSLLSHCFEEVLIVLK